MTVTDTSPLGGAGPTAPTIVHLSGELDIVTCQPLRCELRGVLRYSSDLLILDLAGVTFCDACGLAVLIDIQRRARQRGIVLALAAPRPCVSRLLHIAGLDRSLPIVV
ncbi:STAS domain-containing protein [Nonomuraea sp. LPB2021202275-12-8]|uniref:STAS domain-containing protein n=1 Tax=Nonomuraea sp. LPB2021202275-12-8 TaxID=3120159 RepID=UPI00300D4324